RRARRPQAAASSRHRQLWRAGGERVRDLFRCCGNARYRGRPQAVDHLPALREAYAFAARYVRTRMLFVPKNSGGISDQRHIVCRTRDVLLPDLTTARRKPTRPVEFRRDNFDEQFDATTLFYDAVDLGNGEAVLLAPPFFNLAGDIAATTFRGPGGPCAAEIRNHDRHVQVWLRDVRGDLRANGPFGEFAIPLSQRDDDLFRGRRVIFTMSKNNPIEW